MKTIHIDGKHFFDKEITTFQYGCFNSILAFFPGGAKECDICGRICANLRSVRKHKRTHVEGSKEKFKCTVCGKGFRDRTKLKVWSRHIQTKANH